SWSSTLTRPCVPVSGMEPGPQTALGVISSGSAWRSTGLEPAEQPASAISSAAGRAGAIRSTSALLLVAPMGRSYKDSPALEPQTPLLEERAIFTGRLR